MLMTQFISKTETVHAMRFVVSIFSDVLLFINKYKYKPNSNTTSVEFCDRDASANSVTKGISVEIDKVTYNLPNLSWVIIDTDGELFSLSDEVFKERYSSAEDIDDQERYILRQRKTSFSGNNIWSDGAVISVPVCSDTVSDVFSETLTDAANTLICLSMFSTLKDKMSKDQINTLFNQIPKSFQEKIAYTLLSKTEELLGYGHPSTGDQMERSSKYWKI
jgi:hypothetical protein